MSYTLTLGDAPQGAAAYIDRRPRLLQELKAIFIAVVNNHMKEVADVEASQPTLAEIFRECPVDIDFDDLISPRANRIGRAHPDFDAQIAATGISPFTIAKMTRGDDVSMSVLRRICEVMDCNIGDLVDVVKQ